MVDTAIFSIFHRAPPSPAPPPPEPTPLAAILTQAAAPVLPPEPLVAAPVEPLPTPPAPVPETVEVVAQLAALEAAIHPPAIAPEPEPADHEPPHAEVAPPPPEPEPLPEPAHPPADEPKPIAAHEPPAPEAVQEAAPPEPEPEAIEPAIVAPEPQAAAPHEPPHLEAPPPLAPEHELEAETIHQPTPEPEPEAPPPETALHPEPEPVAEAIHHPTPAPESAPTPLSEPEPVPQHDELPAVEMALEPAFEFAVVEEADAEPHAEAAAQGEAPSSEPGFIPLAEEELPAFEYPADAAMPALEDEPPAAPEQLPAASVETWSGPARLSDIPAVADQLGLANPIVITLLARLQDSQAIVLDASRSGIYRPRHFRPAPWSGFAYDQAVDGLTGVAAGTRILTARGEMAVENLLPGDTALTLRAPALLPIAWIGKSSATAAPILIEQGAFGPDLPRRALCLAPDQAVYIEPVPVPAKRLVNGTTIRPVDTSQVDLFHIDVGKSEILFAEGVPLSSSDRMRVQMA